MHDVSRVTQAARRSTSRRKVMAAAGSVLVAGGGGGAAVTVDALTHAPQGAALGGPPPPTPICWGGVAMTGTAQQAKAVYDNWCTIDDYVADPQAMAWWVDTTLKAVHYLPPAVSSSAIPSFLGPLFHVGNFDTFSHTAVGHRKAQYCLSINGAFPWNGTTAFWFVNSCSPVAGPV